MRLSAETKLDTIRRPTPTERKRGAEVVFERSGGGRRYIILACKCYESWEQFGGVPSEVLSDNVPAVEQWRRHGLNDFEQEGAC